MTRPTLGEALVENAKAWCEERRGKYTITPELAREYDRVFNPEAAFWPARPHDADIVGLTELSPDGFEFLSLPLDE